MRRSGTLENVGFLIDTEKRGLAVSNFRNAYGIFLDATCNGISVGLRLGFGCFILVRVLVGVSVRLGFGGVLQLG